MGSVGSVGSVGVPEKPEKPGVAERVASRDTGGGERLPAAAAGSDEGDGVGDCVVMSAGAAGASGAALVGAEPPGPSATTPSTPGAQHQRRGDRQPADDRGDRRPAQPPAPLGRSAPVAGRAPGAVGPFPVVKH